MRAPSFHIFLNVQFMGKFDDIGENAKEKFS